MSSEALERAHRMEQIQEAYLDDAYGSSFQFKVAAYWPQIFVLLAEVARLEQERDHHEHEAAEWRTALLSESSQRSQAAYDAMAAALAVAREREQRAIEALARAAHVAEHLLRFCDAEAFEGATGPEGQREADYRIARIQQEINEWAALVDEPAAGPETDSGDARDAVVWSEPRQDYAGRFYRDGLGTGTGAEADALLLNATLAEPEQAQSRNTPPSDDSAADTAGEPGLLSSSPHPASASGSASAAADEPPRPFHEYLDAQDLAVMEIDAAADEPGETPA